MGHFPAIRIALGVVFLCLCFPAPGAPAGPSNCSLGATFTVWIPGVVASALVIWNVFSRPWWSPDPRRSFLECLFSARSCYFSIGSLAGGGQLTPPPFLPKILACSRIFRSGDVVQVPAFYFLLFSPVSCFFVMQLQSSWVALFERVGKGCLEATSVPWLSCLLCFTCLSLPGRSCFFSTSGLCLWCVCV